MTTTASDPQVVPREPTFLPALRAADQGVASALESVLFDNTRRVYGAQWRLFNDWCNEVSLRALPAEPLTVARYLAARAGSGASMATLRLAASAIAKAHEWAGHVAHFTAAVYTPGSWTNWISLGVGILYSSLSLG